MTNTWSLNTCGTASSVSLKTSFIAILSETSRSTTKHNKQTKKQSSKPTIIKNKIKIKIMKIKKKHCLNSFSIYDYPFGIVVCSNCYTCRLGTTGCRTNYYT